ncbi:DUF4406 domain-containing protein [Stenotrophomonas chelatiphaga]|uniref:DUF4406 domain-containing protein n=1 Tax=Stenotrophomonas chelatiphaga TaxID=517011 RepID=UPI00289B501D|nr:DUF4406 domain-containing protein [Stenotrophomonas chelatiphaga]
MDQKTKILSPTADDLRQLIICDTDFSEVGQTDLNPETMQRLEQLGWLAEGDENGEYALTASGKLAVRRALGDVVAFVQFKADRVGRTYIAGPMTGHADFNYPAFNFAAALLRSAGIAAINPADHGVVPGATWEDYLRSDIAQLATCESIYFLPGWSQSRGALLEHHIATSLGMRLLFAEGAEPEAVRLRDELRDRADAPDVRTSEGGRRFIAEFFARELRRNDFGRYITTTLAADFACALAQYLAARQPVGEPVTVEAVATVRRGGDGERYIDWLTEGGIADLEVGDVLMVSDRAITDEDGSGEVYAAPPAQAVDLEQFRYLAQWVKDGCNFLQCDPAKIDSSASELLRAINATESAK